MGIDLSFTSTGYYIDSPIPIHGVISTLPTNDWATRIQAIKNQLFKLAHANNVTHVVLETIAYGAIGKVSELSGLHWVIRCAFVEAGYFVTVATPTQLKAFATKKGNASKDAMVAALPPTVRQQFTLKKSTGLYDVTDAYWLSQYGSHQST